ncbi:hypothetical protein P5V15_010093 [Pogonomyrmex californicus]
MYVIRMPGNNASDYQCAYDILGGPVDSRAVASREAYDCPQSHPLRDEPTGGLLRGTPKSSCQGLYGVEGITSRTVPPGNRTSSENNTRQAPDKRGSVPSKTVLGIASLGSEQSGETKDVVASSNAQAKTQDTAGLLEGDTRSSLRES